MNNKEGNTWAVIQTFYRHETEMSAFLKERDIRHFIPMHYCERVDSEGQRHRVLVPIIHNYTFVENVRPARELKAMLADCQLPSRLLCNKDTGLPYEITPREMFEFRALCDPQFETGITITDEPLDPETGKPVEIVHGPFSGIRGRLMRKNRQYWFIKTFADISVMLRITRWYCKPLDSE